MKKLLITGILTVFLVSVCFFNEYDNSLIIGVDANYYPMCYKENEKLTGFEIDYIAATFKNTNIKYKIKKINWQEKYDLLENKKIDLIWSGLVKTDDRKNFTDFTQTYLINKQVIVTKNNSSIKKLTGLANKRIGVFLKSSAADKYLNSGLKAKASKLLLFNNLSEACQHLYYQKIDALVIDSIYINHENKINNYRFDTLKETLGKEEIAIGFRKNSKEFLKLNKIISNSINSNSFLKLREKWFGQN